MGGQGQDLTKESKMQYMLVLFQNGGCDYTIACGTEVIHLKADTEEAAKVEAMEHIDDRGRVDEATLFEVSRVPFDMHAIMAEREAEFAREEKERQEAAEWEHYQQLKAKFGD